MPDTVSTKYGIARVADTDFINSGPATIRTAIDLIDSVMATAITTNPRPAAGKFGRFHRDAAGLISFDTGAGWVEIAQHAHASKHQAGGSDPLTIFTNMLSPDVPVVNVGDLIPTARQALPASGRFAFADGGLIDRTTYAELFANIGHAYNGGVDPGSNLVRLPDLRGRVPVGVDSTAGRLSANDALGQSGGEESHTLTLAETAAHSHRVSKTRPGASVVVADVWGGISGNFYTYPGSAPAGANATPFALPWVQVPGAGLIANIDTGTSGGGGAHNNMQPYQVVNYLVRIA